MSKKNKGVKNPQTSTPAANPTAAPAAQPAEKK
jgi:hypothetical protein